MFFYNCTVFDYFRVDWDGFCDYLRDVSWQKIFNLAAATAASEFYEYVKLGIDVYARHRKYQLKHHIYPWFSDVCGGTNRNHFSCLCQQ